MQKVLSLMLLVVLAALTACNPIDDTTDGDSSENSAGRKPDFTDTSPIKLGFNLEETGDAATFGVSARKGAEIALEELNAAGGILGRPVEAVFDDNQSMPGPAANVASKLINQDHVDVLIGALTSSDSIAMARIANEAGVPMVTPTSTKTDLTVDEDGTVLRYIFRTCFTDDFQGEGMVNFAINGPLKADSAVIFYDAENDYSVGIYETIKRTAVAAGLTIVGEDSYLKSSEADFRAKLNKFKAYEFDVLIVPGFYNQVGMIANQAREVGLNQPLLGGDGFDSPELYNIAGDSIVGSYFTNHYSADDMDPAVQSFIRKYRERFGGNVPDAFSILAYDAVMMVADALERAGSTDNNAVAEALAATTGFKGAAGSITIDENHNATKKLVVLEIREGGETHWVYTYDPLAVDGDAVEDAETIEGATSSTPVEFKIADQKDLNIKALGNKLLSQYTASELNALPMVVRQQYSIVVAPSIKTEQVKPTVEQLISKATAENEDIDEIVIFVYSNVELVDQGFDVAKAEWAPGGKWGSSTSDIARSNDRSSYKLNLIIEENLEEYLASKGSEEIKFGFTVDERKEIFLEIVSAEDRAMADAEKAFPYDPSDPGYEDDNFDKYLDKHNKLKELYTSQVYEKYDIDNKIALQISVESYEKRWPLPDIK